MFIYLSDNENNNKNKNNPDTHIYLLRSEIPQDKP